VREFLARNSVEHELRDVRKSPIPADEAVRIVRTHQRGLARKGAALREVDIAKASDEELRKLFLGREGTLRAPTVSDGKTVLSGFDEESLGKMIKGLK